MKVKERRLKYTYEIRIAYELISGHRRFVDASPSPLAILTGHEQPITCVDVNSSLGLVVSGSQG